MASASLWQSISQGQQAKMEPLSGQALNGRLTFWLSSLTLDAQKQCKAKKLKFIEGNWSISCTRDEFVWDSRGLFPSATLFTFRMKWLLCRWSCRKFECTHLLLFLHSLLEISVQMHWRQDRDTQKVVRCLLYVGLMRCPPFHRWKEAFSGQNQKRECSMRHQLEARFAHVSYSQILPELGFSGHAVSAILYFPQFH